MTIKMTTRQEEEEVKEQVEELDEVTRGVDNHAMRVTDSHEMHAVSTFREAEDGLMHEQLHRNQDKGDDYDRKLV